MYHGESLLCLLQGLERHVRKNGACDLEQPLHMFQPRVRGHVVLTEVILWVYTTCQQEFASLTHPIPSSKDQTEPLHHNRNPPPTHCVTRPEPLSFNSGPGIILLPETPETPTALNPLENNLFLSFQSSQNNRTPQEAATSAARGRSGPSNAGAASGRAAW